MAEVEKLTPEQEKVLEMYRDKWVEEGQRTDPIDFEAAKETLKQVYRDAGYEPPAEIVYAASPLEANEILVKKTGGEENVLSSCFYGSHEASWLIFYDFLKNHMKVSDIENMDALLELAKNSGWVNMYDEMAIIQDRPTVIKMNDDNVMHGEKGPAVAYRDGFEIYAWRGLSVPKGWIMGELTAKEALSQSNMEQRRAACEILGWSHIVDELGGSVIDEDEDPQVGTLIDVDIPDVGRERFLRVKCGTGRDFALMVPGDVNTALEANAWTYNVDPQMIRDLEVRT